MPVKKWQFDVLKNYGLKFQETTYSFTQFSL